MTERALGPSGSRRRHIRLVLLTVLATAAFTVFFVVGSAADNANGCDFAPTGTTFSCLPPLTGSTFEGGDGNLKVNTSGNTDWENVAGLHTGVDLPSGTGDNSFGQGSKTDNPAITVVSGSIPPQKSDLTRFYEASEVGSNNHNFLYLGWERTNNLGSANFNFEINKQTQPDLTTTGDKTLARSPGDMLVTFDFTNGGGRPTIGLLRWLTSATVPVVTKPDNTTFSPNVCFSANSFPCWGDQLTLDGSDSIAAVNNLNAVTDPFVSNTANNIGALLFGETAIDLTKSGVFPSGTCAAFGSAMVTSRSAASFTSEIKDFIAPVPVNISNCGQVTIIKHTDPRGVNQSFSYSSNVTGTTTAGGSTACPTGSSAFSLNDNGNSTGDSAANTADCFNVPAASYTVTEGTEPGGFSLESLACVTDPATGGGSGTQDGSNPLQANITVVPNGHVTCTFQNQATGAILVTKTAKDKRCTGDPLPTGCSAASTRLLGGVTFNVDGGSSKTTPSSGASQGKVCFDGLSIGSHTVNETAAPSGYAIDDSSKSVSVTTAATCSSGTPAAVSFTDSPLTNISASATAVVAGTTNSTITCKDANNSTVASAASGDPVTASTTTGLKPGTYNCQIVIDP